MKVSIKPGARLTDLSPQMALAFTIVAFVYAAFGALACVITSGNDSKHGDKSLHYKGRALDFRTKDFLGNKIALRDAVKEALGADFDVVLEDMGEDNEHLHVEYQPK